jgi:hypothetical protein
MKKAKVWIVSVLTVVAIGAQAQMDAKKTSAMPPTTMVEPAKAADSMLTSFEEEFMGAAKAMPADKFDFSPASLSIPGAKFDGVRTFGEQIKHVTQANYFIYSGVLGSKPDVDVKAIASLKTKEEIIAAAEASFAYGHKAIATLTTANENETMRGERPMSRFSLAIYGAVHGFDHYGQMVEYLRMNGIVPPASAK